MVSSSPDPLFLGVYNGYMTLEENALTSLTKMGGTPVLTFPLSPPDALKWNNLTKCDVCGKQLFLLLQCFAPLPNGLEDVNTMKYIFACNNGSCCSQPSYSWRCLTLTWAAPDQEAEEDSEDIEDPLPEPLPAEKLPLFSFPPAHIEVEEEPPERAIVSTEEERRLLKQIEEKQARAERRAAALARGEEVSSDEDADTQFSREDLEKLESQIDLKNKKVDVAFDAFKERISREPHQVLRYGFNQEMLFMNPEKFEAVKVPSCTRCGGALVMEMQLMPTLLHFLKVDQYGSSEGLDFATVTVFACANRDCGNTRESLGFQQRNYQQESEQDPNEVQHIPCNIREDYLFLEPAPTVEDGIGAKPDLHKFFSEKADEPSED